MLGLYGFSLADIESWGGRLHMSGSPSDKRRMEPLARGELDAIFDEALVIWFDEALKSDLVPLELEPDIFAQAEALGWRKVVAPKSKFPRLAADHPCLDYSGWPLYCNAALPEQTVYDVCSGFSAREGEFPVGRLLHRPAASVARHAGDRARRAASSRRRALAQGALSLNMLHHEAEERPHPRAHHRAHERRREPQPAMQAR